MLATRFRPWIEADPVIGAQLVEEYSRLLAEGHVENCPWKTRGCDGMLCLYSIY